MWIPSGLLPLALEWVLPQLSSSYRCGSGTGSPGLQLAGLPLPVPRNLLLFLAAQYLSCVLLPAHLQPEENQYWGSLLTHPSPHPPPPPLQACWLRPLSRKVWRGMPAEPQTGGPSALNCLLSSSETCRCGRGRARTAMSPLNPLPSPRFLHPMLKGGQGSLLSPC